MTFITVGVKLSCLLRLTLAANLVAHTSQLRDGGLILCWSRIRKFVTYPRRTQREHTEKAITEATQIPWIAGLSRPIDTLLKNLSMKNIQVCQYAFIR